LPAATGCYEVASRRVFVVLAFWPRYSEDFSMISCVRTLSQNNWVKNAHQRSPQTHRWSRLYWRFYRNIVATDDHRLLQCCDRISNTIPVISSISVRILVTHCEAAKEIVSFIRSGRHGSTMTLLITYFQLVYTFGIFSRRIFLALLDIFLQPNIHRTWIVVGNNFRPLSDMFVWEMSSSVRLLQGSARRSSFFTELSERLRWVRLTGKPSNFKPDVWLRLRYLQLG
jgi:hypothetical protein